MLHVKLSCCLPTSGSIFWRWVRKKTVRCYESRAMSPKGVCNTWLSPPDNGKPEPSQLHCWTRRDGSPRPGAPQVGAWAAERPSLRRRARQLAGPPPSCKDRAMQASAVTSTGRQRSSWNTGKTFFLIKGKAFCPDGRNEKTSISIPTQPTMLFLTTPWTPINPR